MKRKTKLISKNISDSVDVYNVNINEKKENTTYTLKSSNKEEASVIIDNGNGIYVNGKFHEYYEFHETFLLMRELIKDQKCMWSKFNRYKKLK